MNENNVLSPEEVLAPPKVDLLGLSLITLVAFVGGILWGAIVFVLGFLSFGQFSLEAGVSPLLLGMITFFALIAVNYILVWSLGNIFPDIYSRARTMYVQVTAFSVILYIIIACVYLIVGNIVSGGVFVLGVYAAHVILNIFGVLLITGIISQYRYSVLVFYANIFSLVISSLLVISIFLRLSESSGALFLLMGLLSVTLTIAVLITFGIYYLYYRLYLLSGTDVLGDVFSRIEQDEKNLEIAAERTLFKK